MITHNLIHVFTIGGGLFIVLLSLHVISWRMFKPIKGEIVPILIVFLLCPLPLIIWLLFWNTFSMNSWDIIFGAIIYYALAGPYVLTYPAITTEIPSFKILLLLYRQGALTECELVAEFNNEEMVGSRVNLLYQDGLIRMCNGNLKLSFIGNVLARVFLYYRMLLGLGVGKG